MAGGGTWGLDRWGSCPFQKPVTGPGIPAGCCLTASTLLEAKAAKRRQASLAAARGVAFEHCAGRYIKSHAAGWRNPKHKAQWTATLETYVYPHLGAITVADVDTGMVLKALEPIWAKKPETASRVRGRIEAVLDWSKARGYREGENPARWHGHLGCPSSGFLRQIGG